MRKLAGAAAVAALVVTGSTAGAQTAGGASAPLWTGIYVGVNGGYGWGRSCWVDGAPAPARGAGIGAFEGCHNLHNGTFGGQVGYNYQINNVVLGLEASANWMEATGRNFGLLDTLGLNTTKTKDLYALTGRIGLAWWQSTLLYAKGGVAFSNENYSLRVGAPNGPLRSSGSALRTGWTLGMGAEYMITHNISAAMEYAYYDFGTKGVAMFQTNGAFDLNQIVQRKSQTLTLRLNYRF